jgi:hypothetical protein
MKNSKNNQEMKNLKNTKEAIGGKVVKVSTKIKKIFEQKSGKIQ